MKIQNIDAINFIEILKKYLDGTDLLSYAAARNIRYLTQSSTEYANHHNRLITEYGEDELDENGNKTGRKIIKYDSPNFDTFSQELNKFAFIEHDVEIYKIPYDEVMGKLTGRQILELDWMLKD